MGCFMPFHLWEGQMPNSPLAVEVFDTVSEKYPEVLRSNLLSQLKMAVHCAADDSVQTSSVCPVGTREMVVDEDVANLLNQFLKRWTL